MANLPFKHPPPVNPRYTREHTGRCGIGDPPRGSGGKRVDEIGREWGIPKSPWHQPDPFSFQQIHFQVGAGGGTGHIEAGAHLGQHVY